MNLNKILQKIERKDVELNSSKKKYRDTLLRIKRLDKKIETHEKAKALIIFVAQNTVEQTKTYIENSITMLLKSVFDENFEAKIIFETKRDQQEARFYLQKGDLLLELRKDVTAVGEVDIYAFGFRIAAWSLEGAEPTILSDEPFKNLSKAYLPDVGKVLKALTDKYKIQQIIITHEDSVIDTADNLIIL